MLSYQRIYWKQRATVRWVKFGDENSKFFQAKATIKYRRNYISILRDNLGNEHSEHSSKATLLWSAFKDRLGKSVQKRNLLNMTSLLHRIPDLDKLEEPFTEEIDEVIKCMPSDKAPGRDGFNGNFLENCWNIIAEDSYKLIEDFHAGSISLQSINASFITLIPEKDSPVTASDFRPIFLLNCTLKSLQSCWLIDCRQ